MFIDVSYVSVDEAIKRIRSGQRVFVHGCAMHPLPLTEALIRRAHVLSDVDHGYWKVCCFVD